MKLNILPRIHLWKHPTIENRLLGMLQGIAEIADGLVMVCSLATVCSNFELAVSVLRTKRLLNHLKKQQCEMEQ